MRDAIKIAKKTVGDSAKVSAHYGNNKRTDRAIQITGCFLDEAKNYAAEIANAVKGKVAAQAGFVCVWL